MNDALKTVVIAITAVVWGTTLFIALWTGMVGYIINLV